MGTQMSIIITTPIAQIEKMVLEEVAKVGNKLLPSIVPKIKSDIVANIGFYFELSPEYKSIANGELMGHFGLRPTEVMAKLKAIVDILAASTQVRFVPLRVRGKTLGGGIQIYAFLSDFSDILSLNEAHQITDAGQTLPWLEWLLIEGDKIIIYDYYFQPGSMKSRSGMGIMVFGNQSYWKVPAQFSGTKNDNWITRTVNAYIHDIELLIQQSIQKHLT